MKSLLRILIPAAVGALAVACSGGDAEMRGEEVAIRSAIESHLRERGINPAAMEMHLSDLRIEADHADAVATFRSEGTPAEFIFEYHLERAPNGWRVSGSEARGQHGDDPGAGEALPEGHPPLTPGADDAAATS